MTPSAHTMRGDGKLSATYPAGRRCTMPGCITILNRYNPGPDCLYHARRVRRLERLGLRSPGYARLWVAIELTREELRRSST